MSQTNERTTRGQGQGRQRRWWVAAIGLSVSFAVVSCGAEGASIEDQADPAAAVSEDDPAEAAEGEGPAETDGGDDADADEEGSGPAGGEASGTLSFDGADITLERLECLQVPAEGNSWRIVGTFDGNAGWVQFDAPSYASIEFSNGDESWGSDADAPLSVSSEGASGDVTMLLDGAASDPDQPEARLVVDITC